MAIGATLVTNTCLFCHKPVTTDVKRLSMLDVIIDSWPKNKPAPTLEDLEIVEYVRAEVVGL